MGVPVVVLTAEDLAYQAVRELLGEVRVHAPVAGARYETGVLAGGRGEIALGLAGPGHRAFASFAEFSPLAVVFAGVAGGLRSEVAAGDVVVATRVYAYHGAGARDDGPIADGIQTAARRVARNGWWAAGAAGKPRVHFGPVVAPEQQDQFADALAVEAEAAGQLDAGPVAVVRAVAPDAAGGAKRLAAGHAAAFAVALAAELTTGSGGSSGGRHTMPEKVSGADRAENGAIGVRARIAELGAGLEQAYATGRLDEATYWAAQTELAIVARRRDVLAAKRLRGLLDDVPDLLDQARAIGSRL